MLELWQEESPPSGTVSVWESMSVFVDRFRNRFLGGSKELNTCTKERVPSGVTNFQSYALEAVRESLELIGSPQELRWMGWEVRGEVSGGMRDMDHNLRFTDSQATMDHNYLGLGPCGHSRVSPSQIQGRGDTSRTRLKWVRLRFLGHQGTGRDRFNLHKLHCT